MSIFLAVMTGVYGTIIVDAFCLQPKLHIVNTVEAHQEATTTEKIALIEVVIDWTPERIEREIRETFPEEPNTAVAIAKCESGLNPTIQSHHTLSYGREQSFGIFQIHAKDHHATAVRLGLTEYKTEVRDNLAMARFLYNDAGGFTPWTCYKTGEYKSFL